MLVGLRHDSGVELTEGRCDGSGFAEDGCSRVAPPDLGTESVDLVVELDSVAMGLGLVADVVDDLLPVAVLEVPEPLQFDCLPHPFVAMTRMVGDGLEQQDGGKELS